MRMIPTRLHAILDYLMAVLLIVLPWLAGFARGGSETWAMTSTGIAILLYSLFTNYELGVIRRIKMSVHLTLDVLAGFFLIVSPWLFGFVDFIWWPHVLLGVIAILIATLTRATPEWMAPEPPAEVGDPTANSRL